MEYVSRGLLEEGFKSYPHILSHLNSVAEYRAGEDCLPPPLGPSFRFIDQEVMDEREVN